MAAVPVPEVPKVTELKTRELMIYGEVAEVPAARPYKSIYAYTCGKLKLAMDAFVCEHPGRIHPAELATIDNGTMVHNFGRLAIDASERQNAQFIYAAKEFIYEVGTQDLDYVHPGTLTLGMAYLMDDLPEGLPILNHEQKQTLQEFYEIIEGIIQNASPEAAADLKDRVMMAHSSKHNKLTVVKYLPDVLRRLSVIRPDCVEPGDIECLVGALERRRTEGLEPWSPTAG